MICVEKGDVGGVCLNVGCIPSKALIQRVQAVRRAKTRPMGIVARRRSSTVAQHADVEGRGRRQAHRRRQAAASRRRARSSCSAPRRSTAQEPRRGQAADGDGVAIEAAKAHRHRHRLAADRDPRASSRRRQAHLRLDRRAGARARFPSALLVIGGGYIGLELGTAYASSARKVTVVEGTEQLLPGNDPELVDVVAAQAQEARRRDPPRVPRRSAGKRRRTAPRVRVETKEGTKTFVADAVLVTVGRRPNSENLGLEKLGVKIEKGFVPVDKQQRTNVPGIYAIGDVARQPMLAHKAYEGGGGGGRGHRRPQGGDGRGGHSRRSSSPIPEIADRRPQEHEAPRSRGARSRWASSRSPRSAARWRSPRPTASSRSSPTPPPTSCSASAIVGPEASDLITRGRAGARDGRVPARPRRSPSIRTRRSARRSWRRPRRRSARAPHLVDGGKRAERRSVAARMKPARVVDLGAPRLRRSLGAAAASSSRARQARRDPRHARCSSSIPTSSRSAGGSRARQRLAAGDIPDRRDRARRRRHLSRARAAGRLSDPQARRRRARSARLPARPRGGADAASARDVGVERRRKPGWTGVWIGERKVASIGIAVRRWVTLHGFALNVATDLSRFSRHQPLRARRGGDDLAVAGVRTRARRRGHQAAGDARSVAGARTRLRRLTARRLTAPARATDSR